MLLIGLLIAASNTITILIAKYLQVEAFTIHFEAFWLFAIASHLLYFLNFDQFFPFLSFFIDIYSSKVSRYYSIISKLERILYLRLDAECWIFFLSLERLIDCCKLINFKRWILYIHLVFTISPINSCVGFSSRILYIISVTILFNNLFFGKISMSLYIDDLVFFRQRR